MSAELPSSRLERVLHYLLKQEHTQQSSCRCMHHADPQWILETDTWSQLETLRKVLCQRAPTRKLPPSILDDIDVVIAYQNSHKLLTSTASIKPRVTISNQEDYKSLRLACWKGDITTLTDVTAIVNAANSRLLGCFQPEHRCIDNVIHSAAGPRLRDACYDLISIHGQLVPTGAAKATPGFLLPAQWVLHTVGPQLRPREEPHSHHKVQLASCYRSCLDAAETLPALEDGRKVVAFCCISTGLFAFPSELATDIALDTVVSWYRDHPEPTITDVIFNTFLDKDLSLYEKAISNLRACTPTFPSDQQLPPTPAPSQAITKARTWLEEADTLIISAGAGLSAATGLDYTSTTLFTKHFPAFTQEGLRKLYDVIGYRGWTSKAQKWGYYVLHLEMVRAWPESGIYAALRRLADRFGRRCFVRTSNADGFFVKNGFDPERVATPQGQYAFLQCLARCRADAVVPSDPFVDRALPVVDPVSQILRDERLVPRCAFCSGEMTLCVRGGRYFNEAPFRETEEAYRRFVRDVQGDHGSKTVVLELGVGLNTPAVLRWPNEDLMSESPGQRIRLVRIGMEAAGCVPWEMEEQDLAVGISGNIEVALGALLS